MEKEVAHWTQKDIADFVYYISSTFVAQLEMKMEKEQISRSQLAARLKKTTGRVSQVFNDPGNLSLKTIAEYARELGMKVGIVAYDDGDSGNTKGPVNPEVFVKCWEMRGRPANLFETECMNEEPKVVAGTASITVAAADEVLVASSVGVNRPAQVVGATLFFDTFALGSPASTQVSLKPIDSAQQDGKEWKAA